MRAEPVILGTAGHIDHGKTSLVRALTGIDTDRLAEEKARGITIELGFAHLDAGGQRFGLIDVPGHERFLRAMVAGAWGIDVVILVIAADEGVMPQTREHLAVCHLLGARAGVVALSKSDLVDADWLQIVQQEIAATLAGSFLEGAAIVPVSARTGAGVPELTAELVRLGRTVKARPADTPLRLPIDRVFTIKGFGTVVTGTISGGRLAVGDEVRLLPGDLTARVRGLESHGEAVNQARAGMRCAVNLTGVEVGQIHRGWVLTAPGGVVPAHLVDVRVELLEAARGPLVQGARCLVHHGTSQSLARVVLAEGERLEPGKSAGAQLHLETPLAMLPGDRFVLRGFEVQANHGTTFGGGTVLAVQVPKLRRATDEAAARLAALEAAAPEARVALEVSAGGPAGKSRSQLVASTGLGEAAVQSALARLVAQGELVAAGDAFLTATALARVEAQALAAIDEAHAADQAGLGKEALRARLPKGLPARFLEVVLAALVRRGALAVDGDLVHRAQRKPTVSTDDALAVRTLTAFTSLETPSPKELATTLSVPETELRKRLDALVSAGKLVRVKPDYLVTPTVLAELRNRLVAHLAAHGEITSPDWKAMVGSSRKYMIPLAEHFDGEKLTMRVGEVRKRRG